MLLTALLLMVSAAGEHPPYSLHFADPKTEGFGKGMGKITFSPDGELLAVGRGEQIELWSVSDSELTMRTSLTLEVKRGKNVLLLAFSEDGSKLFAANGEGKFAVWRVADGTRLQSLSFPAGSRFAVSPDGKRLAVSHVTSTRLISLEKPGLLWRLLRREGPEVLWTVPMCVGNMAFSPDGKLLAIGCEPVVSLRRVDDDGERVRDIEVTQGGGEGNEIYGITFSPDGQLLAVGGMNGGGHTLLKVLTVPYGGLVHDLNLRRSQHKRWVSQIAFSRDGQLLASASWDARAVLWRVSDGEPLQKLEEDPERAEELSKRLERKELSLAEYDLRRSHVRIDGILESITFHPSGGLIAMNDWHGCFWVWRSSEAAR
jgi:WD40 repeat protein